MIDFRKLLLGSLFLACAGIDRADTLVYNDGREITGEVNKTGSVYTVRTKGGTLKIAEEEIATWRKSMPDSTGSSAHVESSSASDGASSEMTHQKASAAAAVARANQSIALGASAYEANDVMAALENFLDARQVLVSNGVRIDPNIHSNYVLLNALGAGCIYAKEFARANEFLDQAASSRYRERSTVLNHAILDYTQHVNPFRPVKNLTVLLASIDKDASSHEFEVNLLGACLDYLKRDDRNFSNPVFKEASDLYTHLRFYLDKAHPGEVQWAGRWYAIGEGKPKLARFLGEYNAWRSAVASREAARTSMNDAEAVYARLRGDSLFKNNVGNYQLASAQARLQQATANYNSIKDEPLKRQKEIEWPEWPPFSPVMPDFPATTEIDHARQSSYAVNRYAVAVPVAPGLLLTAASVLKGAKDFQLTGVDGRPIAATLVRTDLDSGLALLRVNNSHLAYMKLAESSTGGDLACWGFPDVPVEKPMPGTIAAAASAPKIAAGFSPWSISMRRHPRLPGAAVVDKGNALTAIALCERDSLTAMVPSVPIEQIRNFLGKDLPSDVGGAEISDIFELRASH